MAIHEQIPHGGDIYANEIELDFSVNLNPFANPLYGALYEASLRGIKRLVQYPDIKCRKLKKAISEYENVSPEQILCANGASELLLGIARTFSPSVAGLLAPSFSGYDYALKNIPNCIIKRYMLREENDFECDEEILSFLTDDMDIFFVSNPNNPTGRLMDEELLFEILKTCKEKEIVPVIDLCFFELSSGARFPAWKKNAAEICKSALFVNAFTKTLSIPGARLGYLFSKNKDAIERIKNNLPEWNVSVLAEELGVCGARLLMDTSFLSDSRTLIKKEREYLRSELEKMEITVYDSEANFILCKSKKPIYNELLNNKILIRSCEGFWGLDKNFFRISVKNHDENEQLIKAIQKIYEYK